MDQGLRNRAAALVAVALVVVVAGVVLLNTAGRPAAGAAPSWQVAAAPTTNPTPAPSGSPVASATATPVPSVAPTIKGVVRVDQLGYATGEHKLAYLLASTSATDATFTVLDGSGAVALQGTVGASVGSWNETYGAVQPIDLSALVAPGTYRMAVGGPVQVESPPFAVGSAAELFGPRVDDTVAFFQAQRDGAKTIAGDLGRRPSHLNDRALDVFAAPTYEDPDSDAIVGASLTRIDGPVDLEGGWFDAGDFIKFTHTTAYAVGLMEAAIRDLGESASKSLRDEARFGQSWLEKAWDANREILYIQVGIGSGNSAGTFVGDHDIWRLPDQDDALSDPSERYLTSRPAFRAGPPGSPIPPNLAGRMAAALALAAQVDAAASPAQAQRELDLAASIFARAKTVGVTEADVVTALPHAFYPESSWRDDLEWGAAELALAGQALADPRTTSWLEAGQTWAAAYLTEEAGDDTLNLYDTGALAHADLVRALRADAAAGGGPARAPGATPGATEGELLADMQRQLKGAAGRAGADPFGAGAVYDDFDAAPHTFGLITTARLYAALSGDTAFDAFATAQRDWALGANPWGVSLMIGVGTTFPHCPQHVAANLSGTVDGTPPILRGAVVNGPNDAELFADGLDEFFEEGQACPADGVDAYAAFNGHGSQFVDDVSAWQTVEPAIDFTAAALLAFALEGTAK